MIWVIRGQAGGQIRDGLKQPARAEMGGSFKIPAYTIVDEIEDAAVSREADYRLLQGNHTVGRGGLAMLPYVCAHLSFVVRRVPIDPEIESRNTV
jgi:hypothetical protein